MATAVHSTLRHVSKRKLDTLAKEQGRFETERRLILQNVKNGKDKPDRIRTLLEGVGKLDLKAVGVSVKNVKRLLEQSRHDPSVSSLLLDQWQQELEHVLEVRGLKLEYASLFGRLVTEWMDNRNDGTSKPGPVTLTSPATSRRDSESSESTASFEHVGREEMHDQRKEWESYAFNEQKVDQPAIEKYLQELFRSTAQAKKLRTTPLEQLQTKIKDFDEEVAQRFDSKVVQWCIAGLLTSDLFSGSKREALVDLQSQPTVLAEMADVLNMDLNALDSWQWEPTPIQLHMRRALNGKYRVFMDEELHQAILLHFIGTKWAVHLKTVFTTFFNSGAWLQTPFMSMSKADKERREYYLGSPEEEDDSDLRGFRGRNRKPKPLANHNSVRNARRAMYLDQYFMTQLPTRVEEGPREYSDDGLGKNADVKSHVETKQSLLRLATTEMLVNNEVYGHFTILQSDFKWFGPSLPHDTIFAVLKFFGVKEKWLNLFRKFLEPTLVFAQDGAGAEPQVRRRGIPMGHILINKQTKGQNLYRFHDDLWFWGQKSACVEAWKALVEFSNIMGLALNEEKTGCVHIVDDDDDNIVVETDNAMESNGQPQTKVASDSLPKGEIRWGFLLLDPKTRRWVVDVQQVDNHIEELQRQLATCRSVFAWVQAWNSYASTFFRTNFAQPANCLGVEHVDMVLETFKHIQRKLFASTTGAEDNVTVYLRRVVEERFGVTNIPDGFVYFPVVFGGLELHNPFVPLCLVRTRSVSNPAERVAQAFEEEEEEYSERKKKFDSGAYISRPSFGWRPTTKDGTEFFSFEEFSRFPEETSRPLLSAYEYLMEVPGDDELQPTPEVEGALIGLDIPAKDYTGGLTSWLGADPYWNGFSSCMVEPFCKSLVD